MGLDQSIYKYAPGYKETKNKYEQVIADSNDYVNVIIETAKSKKAVKEFINYIKPMLQTHMDPDSDRVKDTITFVVKTVLYNGVNHDNLTWNLYNNMSVLKYDTTNSIKEEVTDKLIELLSWYSLPQEQADRLSLEQSLSSEVDSMRKEVCYWRKYHALNEYILSTFGGDNCEDTELTVPITESILEFIKNDSGEDYPQIEQVEELLANWDNSCTYAYYPWW